MANTTTAYDRATLVTGQTVGGVRVPLLVATDGTVQTATGSGGGTQNVANVNDVAPGTAITGAVGPMAQGEVISGTSAYSNGTIQPLNITTTGNLKTSLYSSDGTSMSLTYSTGIRGIGAIGSFNTTAPVLTNGATQGIQLDASGNQLIATRAITPVVSTTAENNHILKGTPGTLVSAYATNLTAVAGFLVILNATTAPADGAITPLDFIALPANGTAVINYGLGPCPAYSTGITAVVTSAVTPFTKTTGVITAAIHGMVL